MVTAPVDPSTSVRAPFGMPRGGADSGPGRMYQGWLGRVAGGVLPSASREDQDGAERAAGAGIGAAGRRGGGVSGRVQPEDGRATGVQDAAVTISAGAAFGTKAAAVELHGVVGRLVERA